MSSYCGCSLSLWSRPQRHGLALELAVESRLTTSACRAAAVSKEVTISTEQVNTEITRTLSQFQVLVEKQASDALADPTYGVLLLVVLAVAAVFLIDSTTDIIGEALELFEYDRNPRFLPGQEDEGGGRLQEPVRKLRRADSDLKTLMLQSGDEARSIVPVERQIELEHVVRQNMAEADTRETQIVFLLLTWALFSESILAFSRTPYSSLLP
jgi:hypothetical protein